MDRREFSPTILQTAEMDVAVKTCIIGACKPKHHHKTTEEITVIASGNMRMCQQISEAGIVVRLASGASTGFKALEPTLTVVVKRLCVLDDKYPD